MANDKRVANLLETGEISVGQSTDGTYLCSIQSNDNKVAYKIYTKKFELAIKSFWKKRYQEILSDKEVQEILNLIEIECFDSEKKIKLNHRIYAERRKLIYQLNTDTNISVRIKDGECRLIKTPDFLFDGGADFKNQVEPDLTVPAEELLPYIRKHFNVKNEDDVILLTILIVSSMMGMGFNHPVILIQGEKGSGKSECLKKIEMIVDPKASGICTYTNSKEAIVLRLSNSYFTCFDNVSYIPKAISDLFCSAVTGACDTTRKLYTDTEERILNLHSIIAMTSINGVARSADLIDRSCLITLNRFKKSEIKTESNIMTSFQKDLPSLLGAIFNTITIVLADRKKVKAREKIRLADFHEKAIKIGRALGIEEERITDILFRNRMELSLSILESSSIAICMKRLMKDTLEYTDTPTNCLNQLRGVAKQEGIDISTLPKDAARLTKALILIKDELNSVYGIDFNQKRGKDRLYVIKNNNLEANEYDDEE